jgi:hypothetical protein
LRCDNRVVGVFSRVRLSLWVGIAGAIVLYVFFVSLASISPRQVAGLTAVVCVLAVLFLMRNWRVASELADRGGDPLLRLARNRARERRGF